MAAYSARFLFVRFRSGRNPQPTSPRPVVIEMGPEWNRSLAEAEVTSPTLQQAVDGILTAIRRLRSGGEVEISLDCAPLLKLGGEIGDSVAIELASEDVELLAAVECGIACDFLWTGDEPYFEGGLPSPSEFRRVEFALDTARVQLSATDSGPDVSRILDTVIRAAQEFDVAGSLHSDLTVEVSGGLGRPVIDIGRVQLAALAKLRSNLKIWIRPGPREGLAE